MSETPPPPTANPEHQTPPSGSGRTPTGRSQGTIDTAEAARLAGVAIGMGREGLRSAWKKGKEAAAARGVTEETVRQTVERGRVIAAERARAIAAEQTRRRGSGHGRSETPQWPGGLSGTRDTPPSAGSTTSERPGGERRAAAAANAPPSVARMASRGLGKAVLSRAPALTGRRRLGVFPAAAAGIAPIERRLGAFALDLVVVALGFFVLLLAGDVLFGAAVGGGFGGDWLGLSFDDVIRVVTLGEIGRAASGSVSGAALAWQVVYLLGFAAYMIGLEARNGATVGKRVLGLRVVAKGCGGGPIGFQRAAIRNACRVYDLLIPLWPLAVLDAIVTLLSPRRQRSGDWFAGTVVIDRRAPRP